MTWKVVIEPTTEPVSLEEARMHLRLTADEPSDDSPTTYSHPEDSLVQGLITAARQYCEDFLGRALAPQVIEIVIDEFPSDGIQIPIAPVRSIASVIYVDEDGNQQAISPMGYVLDNEQEPGWVLPLIDTEWPTTYGVVNAVRVRLNVGYTNPQDSPNDLPVPEKFKRAMLLLVGNWYENREASVTGTINTTLELAVEALLRPNQLRMPMA